jgi:signal transduction histidine kinase/ActR/RegA family two-component response regulator
MSVKSQLLTTIVGSIVVTAAALTTLAYRAQVASLERDARRSVHMAAQNRAEAVARLVDGQQQRAQRFLTAAAALCGETTPSGGVAWELGCAQRALRELRLSERARGALLTNRRGRIARTGAALPVMLPIPTPLARLVEREGRMTYVIQAENANATVRLQFNLSDLEALFEQPVGLGEYGEVFLQSSAGTFLTPSRFGGTSVPPDLAGGVRSCTFGPSERNDIDYRGIDIIQSEHPVSAFAEPTCVDAHVSHEEALAPATILLSELITRAALFSVVGVAIALIASYWMSAPVQRLAASARALQSGDFDRPIPTSGPSEIRALAHAFKAMAHELGEQMARAQSARHEAEKANHAKDEFLAVLSHELRTPLTLTLGWTRLLRRQGLDAYQTDRAISAIERSALTQKRLIEDLLDVSRIVAGRLQLDRNLIQLNDAVGLVLEELRPAAEEKGLVLESTIEPGLAVSADPLRLQQIVTNLIVNAIKFTPAGGRVSVRAEAVDGHARIAITDSGIGIEPEFMPHIFEAFRQADAGPRRAYGGLGLGLSIVRHLVELHGGTIEATSRGSGQGTSFEVRLPLASSAVDTAAHARIGAPRSAPQPQSHAPNAIRLDTLRVLVVDDDPDTRNVVAALLQDAGATVDGAASAAEGRQHLRTHRYSAIVSDLAMPLEDGYTFIRTVRSSSPTMPAVALTGLTRREDATAAYAAGFQVCLAKPLDRDKLIVALADLTQRKTS